MTGKIILAAGVAFILFVAYMIVRVKTRTAFYQNDFRCIKRELKYARNRREFQHWMRKRRRLKVSIWIPGLTVNRQRLIRAFFTRKKENKNMIENEIRSVGFYLGKSNHKRGKKK